MPAYSFQFLRTLKITRRTPVFFLFIVLFAVSFSQAGEKLVIQIKDFSNVELKGGGFTLSADQRVHIVALGGGEKNVLSSGSGMYAQGWIIDANTRKLVWKMDRDNTLREKDDRKFDDQVFLHHGNYEVYFAAYGFASRTPFTNFNINIDRRNNDIPGGKQKKRGFLQWFGDLFGDDVDKDWKRRSKSWGIDISVDNTADVPTFNPPQEIPNLLFNATKLGENEHIRQRFILSKPFALRIYALGELDLSNNLADYGWITDEKTHKRVWEMRRDNLGPAGGAEKNVKFDDVVKFSSGDFTLYYNTDASHSFTDWNAPPPDDPFNYGISLIATNSGDKESFKLSSAKNEDHLIIVQLIQVGNDETRTASFALKAESHVRIYALGERGNSRRQMADYGWIINTKTRDKVWTMDVDRTEHAGGDDKNRMIDEIITLPKGSYSVFYQTDDSHAYNDWNSSPPYDPEHWGITVSGEGDSFSMGNIERNTPEQVEGVLAQIVRVGDKANKTQPFRLEKSMHVHVYALGEGQNREMYDYGWIENAKTGAIVWEMTYSMTFHAGGGRKNRLVSTTILLDKGDYILHYVSDDSHSFNQWNTDPPEDPTMWGITLTEEK